MISWLRSHRWTVIAILIAFASGWLAHNPRVEVREHQVEQTAQLAEREEQAIATAQQEAQVDTTARAEERRRVVTRRTVHTLPTGERTVTVDRTEETGITVEVGRTVRVDLQLSGAVSSAAREVRVEQVERETTQVPVGPPPWRLSVLGGLDTTRLPHAQPVVGAHLQRRVGTLPLLQVPITAGAWGISSGSGGVSLGVEW